VRLWLKKGIPEDRALEAEEATRGTEHAIAAMEVLLYAKQQRGGYSRARRAVRAARGMRLLPFMPERTAGVFR
jgi:hypothetical protein